MIWLLLAAQLAAGGAASRVVAPARAVLVATIDAACPACEPEVAGREGVMLRLTLDGRYSQHLPVVRPGSASYRVLIGTVDAGPHEVAVAVDPAHSAAGLRGAGSATARVSRVEVIAPGDAAHEPLSRAPFVYQRPNTAGGFSDLPVFAWYEIEPTARGRRYRYSVIFTNEDGGTPADRLMATWGRTTDIEYLYSVEVDGAGALVDHDYQGPEHEVLPYRGTLEQAHPRLWVVTDNNMVVDRGEATLRFAPAPVLFPLRDVSREVVMDAHPWLYAVAAQELVREGKIVADAPPGKGAIPDPRQFVYLEGCGALGGHALAFSVRVGETWYTSDRGVTPYRIVRDGCFRAAVPVPAGARGGDLRAVRVHAYTRDAAPASGPLRFTRLNTAFMLDAQYRPGPPLLRWEGVVELRAGGPAFDIPVP